MRWSFYLNFCHRALAYLSVGLMLCTLGRVYSAPTEQDILERQKRLFSSAISQESGFASKRIPGWQHDYQEALKQSQEQGRYLLIVFGGADWCPWSKKLMSDILNDKAFTDTLKKEVVFVWIDFPPQSLKAFPDKEKLKNQFDIEQLPTIVLTTSAGEEIVKMGFLPLPPKEFALHIQEQLSSYQGLINTLNRQKLADLTTAQLEQLYMRAQRLGSDSYQQLLLQAGLKKDDNLFFLVEQYAHIVKRRSPKDEQVKELRKRIMKSDPENQKKAHFQLAFLDFDALTGHTKKVKRAIEPLIDYINQFGKKDSENLWKVEMAVAQFLFSKGETHAALEHAKASYEAAPEIAKTEVAQTLSYLQGQTP